MNQHAMERAVRTLTLQRLNRLLDRIEDAITTAMLSEDLVEHDGETHLSDAVVARVDVLVARADRVEDAYLTLAGVR